MARRRQTAVRTQLVLQLLGGTHAHQEHRFHTNSSMLGHSSASSPASQLIVGGLRVRRDGRHATSSDAPRGRPTVRRPPPSRRRRRTRRPSRADATEHDRSRPRPTRSTLPGSRVDRRSRPTHTEMLFAIGAGDQVIAVDDQSELPGRGARPCRRPVRVQPNVEAIAGYEPDLVVIGDDFNGLGDQLDGARHRQSGPGRPRVVARRRLRPDRAARRADRPRRRGGRTGRRRCRRDIEAIVAEVPAIGRAADLLPRARPDLFTVTSDTFIGQIYSLARPAQHRRSGRRQPGGYPQLNTEFIVSADPDLIFLADTKCCWRVAGDGRRRDRLGGDRRRSSTATSSRWTTTSPRAGDRASSTTSPRSPRRSSKPPFRPDMQPLDRAERRRRCHLVRRRGTAAARRGRRSAPRSGRLVRRPGRCRSSC